jgi:hypothetical protein
MEARALQVRRSTVVFAAGTALGALLAFFAAPVPAAFAALRYVVSPSLNFGNVPDGQFLTPATAASTIGEAIAVAAAGDSILVAGATDSIAVYPERVTVPAGVSLLGGYSLQEPAFSIRDTDAHQTEIDGLSEISSGPVITVASGSDRSTLIEGFRIRGGGPTPRGGGILLSGASPTIRDNAIFLNTAGTSTGGGGSGIWLEEGSGALIDGNTFVNNTAVGPSATIHMVDSDPVITNNIFYRELGGAAIVCFGKSVATIRFNDFFGNPQGDIVCENPDTLNNLINVDPLLCNPDAGVFTLFDESFLIGAGEDGRTIGAFGPGCHATIKYVRTSGASIYPYFAPSQAADSITTVLALAVAGDTIRVASGVYEERIVIPAGVYVEGNWNQAFTERESERDPSVLDAGGAGAAVTFTSDGGVGAGIDGFAITDGFAATGSAVLIENASPVLRGLTIVLNANESDDGGVVQVNGGSPEIVNTIVALNRGAGVECLGGAGIDIHHSGLYGNTGGAVEGCPGALPANVLLEDPLFCNVQGCTLDAGRWDCDFNTRDFHLFGESRYRDGGENGARIGALRVNCNRTSHFVSATGGDVFPYVTAAGASMNLSAAILVASPGDTVRVAAGSYDESIELKDGVRLEGGWNATFTARDPEAFETVIRGVVEGAPTILATSSNITPDTEVAGFTITHAPGVLGPGIAIADSAAPVISGNVIRGNTSPESGAGIVNNGGLAVFRNNTIVQNTTTSADPARAAGVSLQDIQLGFVFRRNIVYDNNGGYGISCQGSFATVVGREVSQNILFENEGVPDGGDPNLSFCSRVSANDNPAVDPQFCDYAAGDFSIDFDSPASDGACGDSLIGARDIGCFEHPHTFYLAVGNDNAAFPFGSPQCAAARLADVLPFMQAGDSLLVSAGTYIVDETPLEIVNGTTILGNFTADFSSRGSVSAISGESRARCLFIPPGIDSTTIIDGFAFSRGRAGKGGGLYVSEGSSPIVRNISFREMIADSAGAAIYCAPGSSPKIRQCLISFNRRPNPISPMVTLDGSSAEISDCTFFDNLTIGIDILSNTPEVFNNLLFRNDRGGIRCAEGATPVLDHNLAFGNDDFNYQGCDLDPADGNLSEQPLFCDVNGNNLNLFDHSPAATGGRNGTTIGAFPVACVTTAHFVSAAGDSAYPYSTPQTAARRLQDALDVAARRGQVEVPGLPLDVVFVAGDVYIGDIVIPPHVTVLGGYDPQFNIMGTDSTFDQFQRDITLYPVIVQGSGQGSVATVDSGGLYLTTVVDGLVLRGGRAEQGGGIFVEPGGAATFRNCSVEDCAATVAGGGVYISPGSESNFEFFSALRDSAPLGAALYADSTRSFVTNCTIVDNVATTAGGAAVQFGAGELSSFARNIIAVNTGIGLQVDRSLFTGVFDRNVFWMNSVADTSLPATLPPSNVVADPKFCDAPAGDFTVNYKSPAVFAPCARPFSPWFEVAGRFPVGCTDPGHVFLARRASGSPQYPYACAETATPRIVDAAARASDGDTIRVAGETGTVGAEYEENIVLNDRVVLLGGWDSGFATRNPLTNITRITSLKDSLDNPLQGVLLTIESPKDGLGAVVESLAIDSTAIVSGFIFEDGNAGLSNGGAIYCIDASPRIEGNIFKENVSLNFGGAICALRSKDQPIRDNRFFGNRAEHGGAIYLGDCESPIVADNLIYSNRGTLRGGGIRLAQYTGSPSVHDNTIASNTGEGISFAGGSSAGEIYNNIVAYNTRVGMQEYPTSAIAPAQHHNLHWANVAGNFEATEAGPGDVFLSPLFCARAAQDYGLQECSPAIGAGADSTDPIIGHVKPGDPLCADTLSATTSIRFLKNSVVPRFVDVYVTLSERVVDSTLAISKTCENSASIPLDVVPADSTGTLFGFQALETSNCGELRIDVTASDLCENRATASRTISTAVVAGGGAAIVQNKAAGARLEIVEAPAGDERVVMLASAPTDLSRPEEDPALASLGAPVGVACEAIGIESFAGAASLHMRIPEEVAREEKPALAIYRSEDNGWVREPSWLDENGGGIVAHPAADGVYRLVLTKDVAASSKLPARLALHQNAPNPAPGRTSIAFDLPASSHVTLSIFDVSGRRVANLVQKTLPAGRHAFTWNGTDHSGKDVPSGVYFYELTSSQAREVRKLVVLR